MSKFPVPAIGLLLLTMAVVPARAEKATNARAQALQALQREIDARYQANGLTKPIIITHANPGPYRTYLDDCLRRILWASDLHAWPQTKTPKGAVPVSIVVARDGSVIRVQPLSRRGDPKLTRYVMDSVLRAAPFDPLPAEVPSIHKQVILIANFSVEYPRP